MDITNIDVFVEIIGREIDKLIDELGLEREYSEICIEITNIRIEVLDNIIDSLKNRYRILYIIPRCEEGVYFKSLSYGNIKIRLGIRPIVL